MRPIGIPMLSSPANKPRQALVMKLTAPQRGVLASFAFLLISMLSAQALAFDVGGLSYDVINTTDVEVTGRASGNTATSIVILILPLHLMAQRPTALRALGMVLSFSTPSPV